MPQQTLDDIYQSSVSAPPTTAAVSTQPTGAVASPPVSNNAPKPSLDDIYSQSQAPKDDMSGPMAQIGKGFYDTMHQIPVVRQFMDMDPSLGELANEVPAPTGMGQEAGRIVGGGVGLIPATIAGSTLFPEAALAGTAGAIGVQKTAGDLQDGKSIPEAAGSGALTAAGTYVGGKLINAAASKVGDALAPAGQKITEVIGDLYNKAVKPTTAKGNFNLLQASQDDAENAVRAIIKNKPNLELGDDGVDRPKNLSNFSEAIQQTKNDTFNAYNEMQKQATGKGITIDPKALVQELDPIINSKSMKVVSPSTVQYAQSVKDRLIGTEDVLGPKGEVIKAGQPGIGSLTPEEAQDMIKGFNGRLNAFYKNPSPNEYSNTAVDALVANNTRKALDSAITSEAGPGYQALKNQYGSLSAVERDVARAAQRASNYQGKSLLDFSDIFTGDQIVRGMLTANPAEFTSGLVARGTKEIYRYLNNPNTTVDRMFSRVSDLMDKEGGQDMFGHISGLLDSIPQRAKIEVPDMTKNLQGMDAGNMGELFAQRNVSKEPAEPGDLRIGGPADQMTAEGGPVNRVTGMAGAAPILLNKIVVGPHSKEDNSRFGLSPVNYTKNEEGFDSDISIDPDHKHSVIGYGFNIDNPNIRRLLPTDVVNGNRSLTQDEANTVFPKVYNVARNDAIQFAGNRTWGNMSPKQQQALTDMSYNLGLNKLNGFKSLKANLQSSNWANASKEVLKSNYAKEVPNRARRNSILMGQGK